MYFLDTESREAREMFPGIKIRTYWEKQMLVSIVDLDEGAEVPWHSHPHEQCGAVLSGELEFKIGTESRSCKAGDSYLIPGDVEHYARAVNGPARVIDVFSPVRTDYQS